MSQGIRFSVKKSSPKHQDKTNLIRDGQDQLALDEEVAVSVTTASSAKKLYGSVLAGVRKKSKGDNPDDDQLIKTPGDGASTNLYLYNVHSLAIQQLPRHS
jgi:hypothetical protein